MASSSLCIADWLAGAKTRLAAVTEEADTEAKYCLCHLLACSSSYLYAYPEQPLTTEQLSQLDAYLAQRLTGRPLAYVLGRWHFWDFELAVSEATLIPRADTEVVVEQALKLALPADAKVLDLGSGTGAIALALARERPDWQVLGLDIQPDAVQCANGNASTLQLANCRFMASNWFDAVPAQSFELIVSNPPYIEPEDPHLVLGDLRYEPQTALVAGREGLADIEHIVQNSWQYLAAGGWLVLEHGYQQADAVRHCLQQAGFVAVRSQKDYGGNWRISLGQRPS